MFITCLFNNLIVYNHISIACRIINNISAFDIVHMN